MNGKVGSGDALVSVRPGFGPDRHRPHSTRVDATVQIDHTQRVRLAPCIAGQSWLSGCRGHRGGVHRSRPIVPQFAILQHEIPADERKRHRKSDMAPHQAR